jgi:glyoxylase-like metal-dependent hydrolase (beta-lactamase superfamily II)
MNVTKGRAGGMEAVAVPVAAEWFRVSPVSPALTLITEPHADELVSANTWLVRGRERDLLVDCGLGVASLRTAIDPLLSGRDPVLVVTHAHLDHMGSAHEFTECLAHPAEAVGDPPTGSLFGPALAEELGLDETLPPLLISALPHPAYDPAQYRLRPAVATRSLSDGDVVDPGGRPLTALHLPGHSPGSIALFDPADGTLFSGDVVYEGELLDSIVGADRAQYRASLLRLRSLPVRVVRPGHGPSFGRRRLRAIIDRYLKERP